jgi:hypothetical protein
MTPALLLVFLVATAHATLYCPTQAEAVSALRAACLADLGARFYYGSMSLDAFTSLVVNRLQIVRNWESALAATNSAFHGDDDARHFFWPDAWRHNQPTLVAFGALASSDASVTAADCTALVANLATPTTSSLPPAELRDAVHLLFEYAVLMSDDHQCNPENEVAVRDADSGEVFCMVAEDRVCASSAAIDDWLTALVLVCALIVTIAAAVGQIVLSYYVIHKLRTSLSKTSEKIPFKTVSF